jgi:ankyrin repeat protein
MQIKNTKYADSETRLKIISSIKYKRYSKAIEVIESLNNPDIYLSNSRTTALMIACQTVPCVFTSDSLEFIRYLLNNGADINAKNKCGKTALIYAIQRQNIELILYLINSGASLNYFGKNNFTLLDFANLTNNINVIKIIQKALTNI